MWLSTPLAKPPALVISKSLVSGLWFYTEGRELAGVVGVYCIKREVICMRFEIIFLQRDISLVFFCVK